MQEKFSMQKFDGKPVEVQIKRLGKIVVESDKKTMYEVPVRMNNIETEDAYFQYGQQPKEHSFLDIGTPETNIIPSKFKLIKIEFVLGSDQLFH